MESGVKVIKAIYIFEFNFELRLSLCRAKQLHVLRQISERLRRCITSLIKGVEGNMVKLDIIVRA